MQYTGLKDKNGKEVYEGDIVGKFKDKLNDDFEGKPTDWVRVVVWDEKGAEFNIENRQAIPKGRTKTTYDNDWDGEYFICDVFLLKVIGNIYENPQLLDKNI